MMQSSLMDSIQAQLSANMGILIVSFGFVLFAIVQKRHNDRLKQQLCSIELLLLESQKTTRDNSKGPAAKITKRIEKLESKIDKQHSELNADLQKITLELKEEGTEENLHHVRDEIIVLIESNSVQLKAALEEMKKAKGEIIKELKGAINSEFETLSGKLKRCIEELKKEEMPTSNGHSRHVVERTNGAFMTPVGSREFTEAELAEIDRQSQEEDRCDSLRNNGGKRVSFSALNGSGRSVSSGVFETPNASRQVVCPLGYMFEDTSPVTTTTPLEEEKESPDRQTNRRRKPPRPNNRVVSFGDLPVENHRTTPRRADDEDTDSDAYGTPMSSQDAFSTPMSSQSDLLVSPLSDAFQDAPKPPISEKDVENEKQLQQKSKRRNSDRCEPGANDVLLSGDNDPYAKHHPGNLRFHRLIEVQRQEYNRSESLDKALVAHDVVCRWKQGQEPPGRFLKQSEEGSFVELDDTQVFSFTSQALRGETDHGKSKNEDSLGSCMKRDEKWEKECVTSANSVSVKEVEIQSSTSQQHTNGTTVSAPEVKVTSPVVECVASRINHPSMKQVLKRLKEISSVEELWFEETAADDDVIKVCRILQDKNCVLRSLKLTKCNLTVSSAGVLAELLEGNETIQELDISHNALGSDGLAALVKPLGTNKSLKRLVLQDNHLTSKCASSIKYLLRNNSSLAELSLGGLFGQNHLGPKGLKAIAQDLHENRTLRTLSLSHNKLGARGATTLANVVLGSSNTITELDLACNKFGHKGVDALATALLEDRTVEKLNLEINELGPQGANNLVCVLRHNSTLTCLMLGNNNIGDEGAILLAEGLAENGSIETLGLDWNGIGDDGVTAIATSLRRNTTLKTLDLSANQIGVAGADSLAEALQYNLCLTSLNIQDNQIRDDGVRAFGRLFESNSQLVLSTLHYKENQLSDECIEKMDKILLEAESRRKAINTEDATPASNRADAASSVNDAIRSAPAATLPSEPSPPWLQNLIIKVSTSEVVNFDLTSKAVSDLDLITLSEIPENDSVKSLFFCGQNVTRKGLDALTLIVSKCRSLQRVHIRIAKFDQGGLVSFIQAVREHNAIMTLSMVSCGLDVTAARLFADLLRQDTTLKRLNLSQNDIGDDGLKCIFDSLAKNTTLMALGMVSNDITDKFLERFGSADALEEVRLDRNLITDKGAQKLANCHNGQCHLTWLSLSGNQITADGKAALKWCLPEDAKLNI